MKRFLFYYVLILIGPLLGISCGFFLKLDFSSVDMTKPYNGKHRIARTEPANFKELLMQNIYHIMNM